MNTAYNKRIDRFIHLSYRFCTRIRPTEIIAYLFTLLFLYTATNKLLIYEKFSTQLRQSPMIGEYAYFIVWLIPAVEIIISIIIFFEATRLAAFYAAFSLMVTFTAYILILLHFSNSIPCSCGGVLEKLDWHEHLIFNTVFIILAATGILLHNNDKKKVAQRH